MSLRDVRNHHARNFMRDQMPVSDGALFYPVRPFLMRLRRLPRGARAADAVSPEPLIPRYPD